MPAVEFARRCFQTANLPGTPHNSLNCDAFPNLYAQLSGGCLQRSRQRPTVHLGVFRKAPPAGHLWAKTGLELVNRISVQPKRG
jgi:hypothetical protein